MTSKVFDLAVIGGGIIGLAHAYIAAKAGKRVCVVERDVRANGASIRNFGFITVTGQQRGESWRLARRTRDIWAEIAPKAEIEIVQQGLLLPVRREESLSVIESFLGTEMGEGCAVLNAAEVRGRLPQCVSAIAALESNHEVRVESRTALPLLAQW